jgi:hypothetical protein
MLDSRDDLDRTTAAAMLREQAALARRLGRGVSGVADRLKFNELAEQLEAEAVELEGGGSGSASQCASAASPPRSCAAVNDPTQPATS